MTEAELWQVVYLARGNTFNAINSGFLGISGYVMVAYFVGTRLSRFQVLLVSAIFVLYELMTSFVAANQMKVAQHYGAVLIRDFGMDFIAPGQVNFPRLAPLLSVLLVAGSLYFMYQVRQHPELGAGLGKTGSS